MTFCFQTLVNWSKDTLKSVQNVQKWNALQYRKDILIDRSDKVFSSVYFRNFQISSFLAHLVGSVFSVFWDFLEEKK